MTKAPTKIVVIMEGGICQGVCSSDSNLIGAEYTVIDYDSEGAGLDEIEQVKQEDGSISEAIIGGGYVDKITVEIQESKELEKALDRFFGL